MQKFRKSIGYDETDPRADVILRRVYDDEMPWPEVSWLRVGVLTATVKSSAPLDVFQSYNEWDAWAHFIQEVNAPPPSHTLVCNAPAAGPHPCC